MTGESTNSSERLGIAGSGTIALGLARLAAPSHEVTVWARSDASAARAEERLEGTGARVVREIEALGDATFAVEAVVENHEAKCSVLSKLADALPTGGVIASTTSSLAVTGLGEACGAPRRFIGLHVFNPVERMELVELVFPDAVSEEVRARSRALCEALGRTAVEVPDVPGFVVNRLLFPYLFSAVRLLEETGLEPEAIDTCMRLGAGHPMGPLKLLDLVGLDVADAIGGSLGAEVPERIRELIADGSLGRKTGSGFYEYPPR